MIHVFQITTILEEARHFLIVIEHDPMIYEDAREWQSIFLKYEEGIFGGDLTLATKRMKENGGKD